MEDILHRYYTPWSLKENNGKNIDEYKQPVEALEKGEKKYQELNTLLFLIGDDIQKSRWLCYRENSLLFLILKYIYYTIDEVFILCVLLDVIYSNLTARINSHKYFNEGLKSLTENKKWPRCF